MLKGTAKNLIYVGLAELISKLVLYLYTIYLANNLDPEGYGLFNFARTYVQYFGIFLTLGIDIYATREIAKGQIDLNYFIGKILSLKILLFVVISVLLLVSLLILPRGFEVKKLIMIGGIALVGQVINLYWFFEGRSKMLVPSIGVVIGNLFSLGFIYAFIDSSNFENIYIAIAIVSLGIVIGALIQFIVFLRSGNRIRFDFDLKESFSLLKLSFPFAVFFILVMVYNFTDIVMLGLIGENKDFNGGIYSAALKLMQIMILPSTLIQKVFFPEFSKSQNTDKSLLIQYQTMIYSLGIFVFTMVFTFPELGFYIFSEDYVGLPSLLILFSIKAILVYFTLSFSVPQMAWGQELKLIRATSLAAVINVILNFILIPEFGATGAVVSTIIAEAMVLISVFVNHIKIGAGFEYKSLLKLMLISLITYLITSNFGANKVMQLVLCCIIFVILFFSFRVITINQLTKLLKR